MPQDEKFRASLAHASHEPAAAAAPGVPESDLDTLATFQRIGALVASSLSLKETLDAIVSAICTLIGTEDALLAIQEPGSDRTVLHRHPAHGTGALDGTLEEAFRHSLWDGVGKTVMRGRQPQVVRDTGEGVPAEFAPPPLLSARAWVCVPLVSGGEAIGALFAFNSRPTEFRTVDVRAASLLANQAAIAIANARLHEETTKRLRESEALFQVTQALTGDLPLDGLLHLAVEQITAVVPSAGKAVIHLLSGEILEPRAVARTQSDAPPSLAMRAGNGIAGRALALRTLQHVPDTRADRDFLDHGTGVRSLIVAPLIVGERVIGTLSVDSGVPNAFDPDSRRLVASLAGHAALAIERARLSDLSRAEKRRGETILNHMVDGVMLLDAEERIAFINPMLAAMVGLPHAELIGTPLAQAPFPLSRFGQNLPRGAGDAPVAAHEIQALPSRQIFKVFASPVGDADTGWRGHVLVVHDVTRERELDQAKTDFISTVSHELRTPLFSIRGFVKLLAGGKVKDAATRQEFLDIVSQQSDQLASLVNDVLDVTRLDAGQPVELNLVEVDACHLTKEAAARLDAIAAERHIAVHADVPESPLPVRADARRLAQVLDNLLGNAVKFSPDGSRVCVACAPESDGAVRFSVADNGIGIPPEAIPHLFERFYRVDQTAARREGGTGLGLYISRQIVEAHGGHIGVTSTPGKGSCFWFTVPAASRHISNTEGSATHGESSRS